MFKCFKCCLTLIYALSLLTSIKQHKQVQIHQMGAFDFKVIFKNKSLLSEELKIILENGCVNCCRKLDQEKLAPYQAYPCPHVYCAQCVDNKLFPNDKITAQCEECSLTVEKKNMKKSKMVLKVLRIVRQLANCKETPDNRQQIQRQVARKLYGEYNGYFYSCPKCEKPYDRSQRLPNLVCQNQHLLCSQCLKKSHCCQICKKNLLKEIFTNKLIINTSQFIHKMLFKQTVKIVVNDQEFSVVTYSQTSVKDIFHSLQEFDHISNQLEIKLCRFYVEKVENYELRREEVRYDERIGSGRIKKIYLEFDQDALSLGANITMSSKIVKELPIKINNFQQERRPKLEEIQQDVFGEQVQKSKSLMYPQILKSQQLKKKRNSIYESRSNSKKWSKIQEEPVNSQVTQSKLKLVQKSRNLERSREVEKSIKRSKIKRNKQAPLGTQINPKFIQNVNTLLSPGQREKVLPTFLQKHQVEEKNQHYLCYVVQKVMNHPFAKQQIDVSQKMQKQIKQKAKQGDILSLILYLQKKELQDGQIKVIFNPKSSIRSQLTLKTLTYQILTDRFIVTQKIEEDEEFFFEKLNENQEAFHKFIQKHTRKYSQKFGLNRQNIVIHNLVKGPNILTFSTNEGHLLCKFLKNNLNMDIEIHPFFTYLQLSPEDFDTKGNYTFPQSKTYIEFRGNWPYYQPITSTRHGIKVLNMFDNGNNTWLKMNNVPGQWAVGFHAFRNPNQAYKHFKNVILSILNGLHQPGNSNLVVVQNSKQAYSDEDCVNKPGQKVGDGVYLSPMIAETLPYTSAQKVGDKSYHLVFQCRLQPQEIRIPKCKHNFWIVRHPAAIRPYGILVIDNKDRISYPPGQVQFGQNFNYDKYKNKIEIALLKSKSEIEVFKNKSASTIN